MLSSVALITFLATVVVFMALVYGFSSAGGVVSDRLSRLWRTEIPKTEVRFAERQKERAERVLGDIGKLLPVSTKTASRTQRRLMRAGFRSTRALVAFQGFKLLFFAGCISAAYFTKIYERNFLFMLMAAMLGFLVPDTWLHWRMQKRQHRLRLALPDALDLMVVCVEAGLGLDQAILRVSQELKLAHPILSQELQLVNLQMRVGKTRVDALRELADRTGVDDIKALVAMLIQTERFGTSIAQSLRVHSDSLRTQRRQRAEEQAAKAPVKMVPVLVFFIFPALFVVILGPAVITIARQLMPTLAR